MNRNKLMKRELDSLPHKELIASLASSIVDLQRRDDMILRKGIERVETDRAIERAAKYQSRMMPSEHSIPDKDLFKRSGHGYTFVR